MPYVFLVLLLIVVLGSMGWLTAQSGKINKQVMSQSKQETPRLLSKSKQTRAHAEKRRDECQDLSTNLLS
jgi:hypothetical protein